ncbi:glycosyltransferase [Aestuariibius sp. 2305UL40-4]|uniref:glycosyltransferase n=1 Tax=Aestuariibius violaceus TaxID=3234132 RepID=UPI00345EB7F7
MVARMNGEIVNQIIGLIRFSYPAKSGWQKTAGRPKDARAALYDRERLERRFHLFENLTLPSLCGQEDQDFSTGVLIGEDAPEWMVSRLLALIDQVPNVAVISLPVLKHYPATQKAFDRLKRPEASHVTTFRLDDDDAVDLRYIKRLRRISGAMIRVTPKAETAVAFNRGFFFIHNPGRSEVFDVIERYPVGIGLALVTPAESDANIFQRNHRRLTQFYTCYSDARVPTFIRTVHQDNDADPHMSGQRGLYDEDRIRMVLKNNFAVTYDRLMQL